MNIFTPGVQIEEVAVLKAKHASLDRPGLYAKGGVNPYNGLMARIPTGAKYYAMVLSGDEDRQILARRMLKGLRRPKIVGEMVCEKDAINFDQFSEAGSVVLMYV